MATKQSMMIQVIFVVLLSFSSSSGESFVYEDTDDDNGGPSSEFQQMGYEWKMEDLEYTPDRFRELRNIRRRSVSLPPSRLKNELIQGPEDKKFFAALPGVLKRIEKDLTKTLAKYHLRGVVTGRIKSMGSLLRKMKQDGVTDYRQITDIVGLRVTLQTINDILAFKRGYLNDFNSEINSIRCYGVCGPAVQSKDPRMKKYWPWKGSGYRRLHFKLIIPELKTSAEIQVGTPYMTIWADWEHAVVYKGPERLRGSNRVKSYAQLLAQYYMMLDNYRNGMIPRCPKILKKTEAETVFSPHEWKTFGSPDDVCNFWNDLRVNMP